MARKHFGHRHVIGHVHLVQERELRDGVTTQVGENLIDRFHLLPRHRRGHIDHVQKQVRVDGCFQRSPKRRDQMVRQVPDEAHCVTQQQCMPVAKVPSDGLGIERGEELVGGELPGLRQ